MLSAFLTKLYEGLQGLFWWILEQISGLGSSVLSTVYDIVESMFPNLDLSIYVTQAAPYFRLVNLVIPVQYTVGIAMSVISFKILLYAFRTGLHFISLGLFKG